MGRDAGELTGRSPIGVVATTDVEALLELDADCVLFMPGDGLLDPTVPGSPSRAWVDEVLPILASGKNVVSSLAAGMHWKHLANGSGLRDELNSAAGKTIKAGDKVVLWYISSNRDEGVYSNPDTLDVTRTPKENPHQAFGGGGPHHCLGHVLARATPRTQIWEIYTRMKDLKVGEPDRLLSNFMNGVKRLPGTWTPER